MKKTAVLTAILTFVFSGAVYADFSDMQGKSEEMINSVELLAQKRYVNGKSETEFDRTAIFPVRNLRRWCSVCLII